MNYRNSPALMWGLFIISMLVLAVGSSRNEMIYLLLGVLCIIGGILQAAIFYRCPHCYESLMRCRGSIPKHCPHCGKELK